MSSRRSGRNAPPAKTAGAATSPSPAAKWINAGPDEGALHALLRRVAERVPHERIDVLWIFPPRVAGGVESTVVVIAGFDQDPDRRTVATAHFKVTRDRRGRASVELQMQEHGSAPVGATQRVVDGVLRRLGDEVGREAPRRVEIAGDADAWWMLYQDVGGEPPEDALAPVEAARQQAHDAEAGDASAPAADSPDAPRIDDAASTPPHGDVLADEIGGEHLAPEHDDGGSTPPHGDVPRKETGEERLAPDSDEPASR